MPVELKEGAFILVDTIKNNLRHQDYMRVVEIATDYTIYATGDGIATKLRQFNLRETIEAFNQRVALTFANTPAIVNSVRKPLEKIGKTPAHISFLWKGKDAKSNNANKETLIEVGNNFYGEKSVEKYIAKRLPELDSTDPNSFIVVEFKEQIDPKSIDKKKPQPYPFEVNSKEAINYQYKNNTLQWLIVLNDALMLTDKGALVKGEVYYIYIDNETVRATEIDKSYIEEYMRINSTLSIIPHNFDFNDLVPSSQFVYQTDETPSKARYFRLEVFEHKIGKVPAKRVGTITDETTRGRTCVPVIHAAQSYFEKSIKTMSEFDLTNCLHTFPQKIQYGDPCDGTRGEGNNVIGCISGLTPGGVTCKACNGSGFKGHTSAQDVIQIRMPKDPADIVSLENILVYKHPPIDLLEFQRDLAFDKLQEAAQSAVYNGLVKIQVVKTATENQIDLESVYDTLAAFAETFSDFYVFLYGCIASLKDIDKNLIIVHKFPSDFKMQSLSSLLDELKNANENGAASYVKDAINNKIINKMYIDQPRQVLRIETQSKYFPFPGKTIDEINFVITSGFVTKYNCILYANFGYVFSNIEKETHSRNLDFYQMDEALQSKLILASVTDIINQIDKDQLNESANALGENEGEDPADIEAREKARLKSSSAGITSILEIQTSYSIGTTDRPSAIKMLQDIFGFTDQDAEEFLGEPKPAEVPALKIS